MTEIRHTTNQIYQVVKHEKSFYRRALIYNIYYKVCLGNADTTEAFDAVSSVMNRQVPNEQVRKADSIINALYNTNSYQERIKSDGKKIEVLSFIIANETDALLKNKIQSVTQELRHDIELWAW